MGEGIHIPIPVFRWRSWSWAIAHMTGEGGVSLSPQVWVKLTNHKFAFALFLVKVSLFLFYLTWQLYAQKSYLELAGIQGTARVQMQHPVQKCNPLHPHCKANFSDWDGLPYCKQHIPKANESFGGHRETCEYMDEFDLIVPAPAQSKLLIPTRRTLYQQNVLCSGREKACEKKYEVLNEDVTYIADIESFTLLIDHSVVCSELKLETNSWEMVGLYQPSDAENPESIFSEGQLMPIRTRFGETIDGQAKENKAFTMWMETNRLFTFLPFLQPTAKYDKVNSPFYKIPNGDVIRVGDLLKELGVDLDKPLTEGSEGEKIHTRRVDGMVIVIYITYKNYKFYTWPNRLPPVYIYKFELIPASEYKIMIDHEPVARQIGSADFKGRREVDDRHGILVVVKQCGEFGVWSWSEVFLLILGYLVFEGLLHSVCKLVFLNCISDKEKFEDLLITNVEIGRQGGELVRDSPRERTLEIVHGSTTSRGSSRGSGSDSEKESMPLSEGGSHSSWWLCKTGVRQILAKEHV